MRQLSPPLRRPSDSEVGSLFSHLLLLLHLPLPATRTGAKCSHHRRPGSGGRWKDQQRRRREAAAALQWEEAGAWAHEAEHIWARIEKKICSGAVGELRCPSKQIIILHWHRQGLFFTETRFLRIFPPLTDVIDLIFCLFVCFLRWNPIQRKKNQEDDRTVSQHGWINSRHAAFVLWARWFRMLTRRLSSNPGTEGVM